MNPSKRSPANLADAYEPELTAPIEARNTSATEQPIAVEPSERAPKAEQAPSAPPLDRLGAYLLGPTVYCA